NINLEGIQIQVGNAQTKGFAASLTHSCQRSEEDAPLSFRRADDLMCLGWSKKPLLLVWDGRHAETPITPHIASQNRLQHFYHRVDCHGFEFLRFAVRFRVVRLVQNGDELLNPSFIYGPKRSLPKCGTK